MFPLVIKRDTRVASWDTTRIQHAIFKAAINVIKDPVQANLLANNVSKVVERSYLNKDIDKVSIDQIQTSVVSQLKYFNKEVATEFLEYKTAQDIKRV